MKRIQSYLLLFLGLSIIQCNTQQKPSLDKTKIVNASELNFAFSDKRGIESDNGMIYLVEPNMKVLSAYKNGIKKWKADIITKCGEPMVGKAEIRFIKLNGDKINVVFGKHSYAVVSIATGNVVCSGSD